MERARIHSGIGAGKYIMLFQSVTKNVKILKSRKREDFVNSAGLEKENAKILLQI